MRTQTVRQPHEPVVPDAELLERSAAGDRGAFRDLHRRYEAYAYWLALRLTADAADAEDAVQEAWLRVYARAADLRQPDGFRGWLRSIVVRCSLDARRRRARGGPAPWEDAIEVPAFPPAHRLDLERAIRDLPEDLRAVLVLHDVEGLAHREVGELLEISEEASRARLSRARRRLREGLGER